MYSLYVDMHMDTCIVLEFLREYWVRDKVRMDISHNLGVYGSAQGNFIFLGGKRVIVGSLENTSISG